MSRLPLLALTPLVTQDPLLPLLPLLLWLLPWLLWLRLFLLQTQLVSMKGLSPGVG